MSKQEYVIHGVENVINEIVAKTRLGFEYIPNSAKQMGTKFIFALEEPEEGGITTSEALQGVNEPTSYEAEVIPPELNSGGLEEATEGSTETPSPDRYEEIMGISSKTKLAAYVKEELGEVLVTKDTSLNTLKNKVVGMFEDRGSYSLHR